ncbi:hypothetical protein AK95_28865 [Paenibacillus sp. LC231]|uniref:hypothetical protein n=1 Tax=Paenibacillus sp. LC231 TaxID=1120679 RepID=UPI0008DD2E25|nr:hypothetical protein [Paenibacillus sp. LC231]OIB01438.1 hypothetical protein AK95_28865 [Paenibacillus sp. LC231]
MYITFEDLEKALGRELTAEEVLNISRAASIESLNENASSRQVMDRALMIIGALNLNSEQTRRSIAVLYGDIDALDGLRDI